VRVERRAERCWQQQRHDDAVPTAVLGSEMDQREGREGSGDVRVRFRGRRWACSHEEARVRAKKG
jgi:hypothetical protein